MNYYLYFKTFFIFILLSFLTNYQLHGAEDDIKHSASPKGGISARPPLEDCTATVDILTELQRLLDEPSIADTSDIYKKLNISSADHKAAKNAYKAFLRSEETDEDTITSLVTEQDSLALSDEQKKNQIKKQKMAEVFTAANHKLKATHLKHINAKTEVPVFDALVTSRDDEFTVLRNLTIVRNLYPYVVPNTIDSIDEVLKYNYWSPHWSKIYSYATTEVEKEQVLRTAKAFGVAKNTTTPRRKTQLMIRINTSINSTNQEQIDQFNNTVKQLRVAIALKKEILEEQGIDFDDHFFPIVVHGKVNRENKRFLLRD